MTPGTALKLDQARSLCAAGKAAEALRLLQQEVRRHPADADLCSGMSLVLTQLGQAEQALFYSQKAAAARPGDATIQGNLGNFLGATGKTEAAEAAFRRALAVKPDYIPARVGLGNTLRDRRHFTEALEHIRIAMEARPEDDELAALAAALLTNIARIPEAVALCAERLARREALNLAVMHSFSTLYLPGATAAGRLETHRRFARLLGGAFPRRPAGFPAERDPERRLRIGVLSHELRQHAVAGFLEPWLANHDRERSELVAFSLRFKGDAVTARLRPHFTAWHDAATLDEVKTFGLIAREKIDILVDTTGLTQGNRIGVLSMKPAPVQVMLLGYLCTTGLDSIDYRIADSATEPAAAEAFSTEKIARLDPTYLAWRPPAEAPAPAPPPSAAAGHITFGSFNQTTKLNDELLRRWARVLDAVPGSRMFLKAVEFDDPKLRESIADRFAAAGVSRDRLTIEGATSGIAALLGQYARVDIALDTHPFNGTATTLDALWMGVPVVTLPGDSHAGRTGVSILSALGARDWIAADEAGYTAIAAALAANPSLLATLRGSGPDSLRARLEASPLRDEGTHARRMDDALRGMWRDWCASATAKGER